MTTRRGFALMASLWVMVALSAIAGAASITARMYRRDTIYAVDKLHARTMAEAGFEQARSRLAGTVLYSHPDSDPWNRLDTLLRDTIQMNGWQLRVEYRDLGTSHINNSTFREIFLESRAWRTGSNARATVEGVIVRVAGNIIVTWRRII